MTPYDYVLVVLACVALVYGARVGGHMAILSILGLAAGVALASLALPWMALRLDPAQVSARSGILDGGFFFLMVAGLTLGRLIAGKHNQDHSVQIASRFVGAVSLVAATATATWVITPALQQSPVLGSWTQRSAVNKLLALAPDPPIDLARLVAEDYVPAIVTDVLGTVSLGAAPTGLPTLLGASRQTAEAASVQVFARACGGFLRGSGFSTTRDIVVTNAHVVAGSEDDLEVVTLSGKSVRASVISFDPDRDLALLYAPDLNEPSLRLASGPAGRGDPVVTLGHPNGQTDLAVSPARIVERRFIKLRGIYGGNVDRQTYVLRTDDIAPGSSGSAVVNEAGEVVGIVEAGPPDGKRWAIAVSAEELRPMLGQLSLNRVSTQKCAT